METNKDLTKAHSQPIPWNWKDVKASELMFCLALISVFLPYKIYPIVFLICSLTLYLDTTKLEFRKWTLFLSVFSFYAVISFLLNYDGQTLLLTNIIKLLVNFIFLYFAVSWLGQRDNSRLLQITDYTFHLIFLLILVQLAVYHQALNFKLIYGSTSSGQASLLYSRELFFWGLDDKNMFGARIAMLGFPYILIPIIRSGSISIWRIILVFALAYLSLSRTPIVALMIGCGFLIWISSGKWPRIVLFILIAVSSPFILEKIIRVDQLTASNDGMGVRLVYWKAFFQHFTSISPLGNGFLSAPQFLADHADFYHGEPHIHNTFMSTYLEMGIIGFISYALFLIFFIRNCIRKIPNYGFWITVFLPILSIMCILYSGYDNDIILYLILIFLLGTLRQIDFKAIKIGI